jgi:hypothetical protein
MLQLYENSLAEEFSDAKRRAELSGLVRQVATRASAASKQKLDLHQALRRLIAVFRFHLAFQQPYYDNFLIEDATKENSLFFFTQARFLDARFDDAWALLQLGTTGIVKNEIGSNFWDELGNGNLNSVHIDRFAQSLRALGIMDDDLSGSGLAEL